MRPSCSGQRPRGPPGRRARRRTRKIAVSSIYCPKLALKPAWHFLPTTRRRSIFSFTVSCTSPPPLTFRLSYQNQKRDRQKTELYLPLLTLAGLPICLSQSIAHTKPTPHRQTRCHLPSTLPRWPLRRHTRIRVSIAGDGQPRHNIRATQRILHRLLRSVRIDYHTRISTSPLNNLSVLKETRMTR